MIPTKLTMSNFMCYRDNVPTLDFTGLHVACLCGDNGSGKSTIFDAITWALWGKASRGDNDDLLHTGSNEMSVELEFQSGDRLYRVVRKYTRGPAGRSGQSLLDLQLFNEGMFRSVSEHTKTETQDKISGLLHLDYQTFINSAMILQGRANEFSRKRPGERKEILAGILDLAFYDGLEQQARLNAEARKLESANLDRDVQSIAARLETRPQYAGQIKDLTEKLKESEARLKKLEADVTGLRGKKEALSARREQLSLVEQQAAGRTQDLSAWRARLEESSKSIGRLSSVLQRSNEIEQGYASYTEAAAAEEELNEKLKKSLELVDRRTRLAELVTAAQNTFNVERKTLLTRIGELESKAGNLPQLKKAEGNLQKRQADLRSLEDTVTQGRKTTADLRAAIATLSARISQLTAAAEESRQKVEMLSHAGARCPLCDSELGPEGCRRLVEKLNSELKMTLSELKESTASLSAKKAELASLEKQVAQGESKLKAEADAVSRQTAVVGKQIAEIEDMAEELSARKEALRAVEDSLREKKYAVDAQHSLEAVEQELRVLAYDSAAHGKASERRKSLQPFEQQYRELPEARLQLESHQRVTADATAAISRLEKELESLRGHSKQIGEELSALPAITQELAAADAVYSAAVREERADRDNLAQLNEKLKQLDALASEKDEKARQAQLCAEEESLYTELGRDFSKRGIQAVIIEEAVPEINNEANMLLGRMTANRMSLKLETQRDTKKGETVETLDINIADELGTRSYEMYSGGEAFRIDLALRIAISRLLVRRAGASMPILIIDEGFGTQDDAGLEKLVEAINSIQDDFEKLFVITHLDELKDRFPALITVTKTAEGSVISVTE